MPRSGYFCLRRHFRSERFEEQEMRSDRQGDSFEDEPQPERVSGERDGAKHDCPEYDDGNRL